MGQSPNRQALVHHSIVNAAANADADANAHVNADADANANVRTHSSVKAMPFVTSHST